jgi:SAM-dependent MidA family methyltransferase
LNLVQQINGEIRARGILSFARFMEIALYCPVYGYYEKEKDTVGRAGDFYTNVSVGSLFGELLAFQFAEWLEPLNSQLSTLNLVEAGAHDGQLAKDILSWLQLQRPELFGQIEYWIIEPSARRQEWQQETLKLFAPRVRWFTDFENLKLNSDKARAGTQNSKLSGIIFSNELLDAMPVHRLGWDANQRTWFEWGVAVEGERFVWAKIQNSKFKIQDSELEAVLPDGYTIEINPAAENWWCEAAGALNRGRLVAIDYGFTAPELFSPARTNGTLRSYRAHHHAENVLANPGGQDITAHVNFAAIQAVGEKAGLKTEALVSQPQFLTRILEKTLKEKTFGGLVASNPALWEKVELVAPASRVEARRRRKRISKTDPAFEWTPSRTRQFQTLTHPEHLGRPFRVLVQSK